MLAGLAQHFDQQVRCAVDDLRLIAEVIRRQDEPGELHHLLDIVESGGCLHLREQVERARAGRGLRLLDRNLVRTTPGQPRASLR